MADTISATIQIGINALAATTGPQGFPYAFPAYIPVSINSNINAVMGVKGTIALPPIVMTTALVQTSIVSVADAGTTPAQSLVTVQRVADFEVGQPVDIYEVGQPANRESSQIMAISGKVLTLRPKLTKTHPKGAVIAATGGMKAQAYGANYKIADIRATVRISGSGTGQVQGFQPHIEARVPISINISGSSFPPLVTGYTFIPPIQIKANIRGQQVGAVTGTANAPITIYGDLFGNSQRMSGDIDSDVVISIAATGLGYTLRGTLSKVIQITGSALATTPVNGPIAAPVVITAALEGNSDTINSLYGVLNFRFASFGYMDASAGTINQPLPITATVRGQAVGGANASYGFINKPIQIKGTAVGRLTPIGRTFTPAKLGIIMGRTEVVGGVDRAVFRAAEGRSYLSQGVPVPSDFFFGSMSGSGPVARATVTIAGSNGTLAITVGGASIMESLPVTLPLTTFCQQIAKAINDYAPTAFDYTARAYGTTVTIFAPPFSGATMNGESVSFIRTGNVTINNQTPPVTVAVLSGGQDGNVLIQSSIEAKQYDDGSNFGIIDTPVMIVPNISASANGNTGTIAAPVRINATLLDGIYGTTVSKLNVHAAVAPIINGVTVPKVVAHPIIIHTPSSQHVAKAVAYVVIGPEAGAGATDTYEAMFFF